MSRPIKTRGQGCDAEITMSGSRTCRICDPDIEAIVDGRAQDQTPDLCDGCFQKHMEGHQTGDLFPAPVQTC